MKHFDHKGNVAHRGLAPFTSSTGAKVEEASKGFSGGKSYEHQSNEKTSEKTSGLSFKEGGDGYLVNSPNANPKGKMGYST